MTTDQLVVIGILAAAGIAMGATRLRVDLVALLVVLALALSGVCTTAQAVAGFGSTVVVMVGSLLVVGEALSRTGVAAVVGDWILRLAGDHEGRTMALLALAAGVVGSVMSSTAVVALFLPVALRIADERQLAPARLLLPLAYSALISGMLTLIGTAPNLVVHAELRAAGRPGLRFFDVTPIGAVMLALLIASFLLGGRWLLPAGKPSEGRRRPSMHELWQRFVPRRELQRLSVGPASALAGRSLRQAELGSRHGVRVVAVERVPGPGRAAVFTEPSPDMPFRAGDVLIVSGPESRLEELAASFGLERLPDVAFDDGPPDKSLGAAVVMVHPESGLVGRTVAQVGFRARHHLQVAGVRRDGEALVDFVREPLRSADLLLVLGSWSRIRGLASEQRDFVLLTLPAELALQAPARPKLPVALCILAAMVTASAAGLLPMVTSALAAAVLMVLTRCVSLADTYQSMHWSTLVLIGGMLPLAGALDRTGALVELAGGLQGAVSSLGPRGLLALLFLITALVGAFVSNTATAVLMAPVALRLAEVAGVRPEALAVTVAIACSSAFLTPVGSPVVTLVFEPGGYRTRDLLRAGSPMLVLTLLTCTLLLPWLFPF